MSGICTCQFVVEADGGVYPCDFYVIDEWYLGNLTQSSFEDIRSCKTANRFIEVSKYIIPVVLSAYGLTCVAEDAGETGNLLKKANLS